MEEKFQYKGHVISQKIVKAENPTLVVFKLQLIAPLNHSQNAKDQLFTSLIARHPLTFLQEVVVGDLIHIYGHYNQKKQFVTEKYLIEKRVERPEDRLIQQYPPQKRE